MTTVVGNEVETQDKRAPEMTDSKNTSSRRNPELAHSGTTNSTPARSRRMGIPVSRSLVCDILRYDRYVPTCAHDRTFNIGALTNARKQASVRVSWPAIFLKAYGLNARRFPRLRQTWMTWPTSYLYSHPEHVATLVVHRKFEDDDWLFWGQIPGIEKLELAEIQRKIDEFQTKPVEEVFRRQLWLARKPAIFRRLCWWLMFQVSGRKKCKRLGTFFLSTISGKGAEIQEPPSMLTSGFTYGPIDEAGNTRVTITYDHRMMDGHHIADILASFERTLQHEMVQELSSLSMRSAA